jgi:hypothetical protein
MSNTVTLRTLIDGQKEAVVLAYLKCDGASGELTDSVIVDVSTFSPAPSKVTVLEIWANIVGFDAILEFDATTDVPFWKLPGSPNQAHFCFESFGGIKDNSGTGTTGDIILTTAGFTAATDEGTIIIRVRKD